MKYYFSWMPPITELNLKQTILLCDQSNTNWRIYTQGTKRKERKTLRVDLLPHT
jgi:hypothetical protein